jgi:hypothetical protein
MKKITLSLSSFYLGLLILRQYFRNRLKTSLRRYTGSRITNNSELLPLYFRFFLVSLVIDTAYGLVVLTYEDQEDIPYWLGAILQGLGTGISITVGVYLCQRSAGSRAIKSAVMGGILMGFEKIIFVAVVEKSIDMSRVEVQNSHAGLPGLSWIFQDFVELVAYLSMLTYTRLQEEPRPGSTLYCTFQVQAIAYHSHAFAFPLNLPTSFPRSAP